MFHFRAMKIWRINVLNSLNLRGPQHRNINLQCVSLNINRFLVFDFVSCREPSLHRKHIFCIFVVNLILLLLYLTLGMFAE
jgi:hypothetical protein